MQGLKQGFQKLISKEITIKSKNINLDYMIYPTFRNINRLFVSWFKNDGNDPAKNFSTSIKYHS